MNDLKELRAKREKRMMEDNGRRQQDTMKAVRMFLDVVLFVALALAIVVPSWAFFEPFGRAVQLSVGVLNVVLCVAVFRLLMFTEMEEV